MRIAIFTLFSLLLVGCDIPTGSDADESSSIVDAIESKYPFRVMSSHDKRQAVYAKPHRGYSEVFVYGDYSSKEQDEICAAMRTVRHETATKPIRLYFYPRELEQSGLMRKEVFE